MPQCKHPRPIKALSKASVLETYQHVFVCRDCHAVRAVGGHWARPAPPREGAHLMWIPKVRVPRGFFEVDVDRGIVAPFKGRPPFLLPKVDLGAVSLTQDLVVGKAAVFCVDIERWIFVEGKVVCVGLADNGDRGFVATTHAGVVLIGWGEVKKRRGGDVLVWRVAYFGEEAALATIVERELASFPHPSSTP